MRKYCFSAERQGVWWSFKSTFMALWESLCWYRCSWPSSSAMRGAYVCGDVLVHSCYKVTLSRKCFFFFKYNMHFVGEKIISINMKSTWICEKKVCLNLLTPHSVQRQQQHTESGARQSSALFSELSLAWCHCAICSPDSENPIIPSL